MNCSCLCFCWNLFCITAHLDDNSGRIFMFDFLESVLSKLDWVWMEVFPSSSPLVLAAAAKSYWGLCMVFGHLDTQASLLGSHSQFMLMLQKGSTKWLTDSCNHVRSLYGCWLHTQVSLLGSGCQCIACTKWPTDCCNPIRSLCGCWLHTQVSCLGSGSQLVRLQQEGSTKCHLFL
jgi:hypothetical protein